MKKRYATVISLLSISLALIILISLPSKSIKKTMLSHLPTIIGKWQGKDIPLDKQVYEMLFDSDLLFRIYRNNKVDNISLFIVVSKSNFEAFHPPELCLEGSGGQLMEKDIIEIQSNNGRIKINKLYIKQQDKEILALYWYKAGKRDISNFYVQYLDTIFDKILRRKTTAGMIRVIVEIKDGKTDKAFEIGKSFLQDLVPILDKYLT